MCLLLRDPRRCARVLLCLLRPCAFSGSTSRVHRLSAQHVMLGRAAQSCASQADPLQPSRLCLCSSV